MNLSGDTVSSFVFTDEKEDEYKGLVESSEMVVNKTDAIVVDDGDEINVDDI